MARRSPALTPDDVAVLPGRCAGCLTWERYADGAPLILAVADDGGEDAAAAKRRWWVQTLSAGTGGGVVVRAPDRAPANGNGDGSAGGGPAPVIAYATYALPLRGTGGDALGVLGLHVADGCRGMGLGRALVRQVAREALRRPRVRAVEATGVRVPAHRSSRYGRCVVPLDFWLACGFTVVREHPLTPRVRLDARVLAAWRSELEEAVELAWTRVRGAVRPPEPAAGPALTQPRGSGALRVRSR